MLRYIFVFVAALACASAATLTTTACPASSDKPTGTISEVYSPDVADASNIILKKGNTYTFGIKFTAGENTPFMEPTIYGIIGGIEVEWTGVNKESCQDLIEANKCPIVKGRTYHYSASIKVLDTYPATKLTFQWALTSRSIGGVKGTHQVCFRMPAQIVN